MFHNYKCGATLNWNRNFTLYAVKIYRDITIKIYRNIVI